MPVEDKSNTPPTSLSRRDQLRLKEYDSLNFWNDNESKVNLAIDALPISVIGGIAYIFSKIECPSNIQIIVGVVASILVVILWLVLSKKYSDRVDKRFKWMQEIERELGFSAHIRMTVFIKASFLQHHLSHLRARLVIVAIVVASVLIAGPKIIDVSMGIIVPVALSVAATIIFIDKVWSCFKKVYRYLCGRK